MSVLAGDDDVGRVKVGTNEAQGESAGLLVQPKKKDEEGGLLELLLAATGGVAALFVVLNVKLLFCSGAVFFAEVAILERANGSLD